MAVTTRGGSHTITLQMLVDDDEVREKMVASKNADNRVQTTKDGMSNKVVKLRKLKPIPRPSPPFPQRLKKKEEEDKFANFISMLKQLSINIYLIAALERMPRYDKFLRDLLTMKRMVRQELSQELQYCGSIATRSLV